METMLKCSHRNSYMTYSEAVLLDMLGDDPAVRAEPRLSDGEGQNQGTKHRQNDALASSSVNPHASTYRELLNVPDMVAAGEDVELSLARGMSDAEIMISEISSSTPEFPPTQSTERAVKVTTKASAVFFFWRRASGRCSDQQACVP